MRMSGRGPNPNKAECPLGETQCSYIDALQVARREIESLSDLVITDPLTRLYNYRHLLRVIEQELERTRRNGQPTALIMLDLDHFKQVNDNWGHEVGNRVLCHVAELIRNQLRKIDIACRYGGEEFSLILPGTALPRAVNAANRLRETIAETPLLVEDEPLFVTASMGVAVYERHSTESPESFIRQADARLYEAKHEGRDRVAHATWRVPGPRVR